MNKDKKWLLHEIRKFPCDIQRGYLKFRAVDILPLIDQLDETKKAVIPRFVAEAFEKAKVDNWFAPSLINVMYDSSDEVAFWLEIPSNEKLILRAWLDGYEIEKEKLYYVKLPNTNSKGECLYLAQGISSGDRWFNSELELIEYDTNACRHKFTESEIKSINEYYWHFAEPVKEEY